jgi:hypothetical protein
MAGTLVAIYTKARARWLHQYCSPPMPPPSPRHPTLELGPRAQRDQLEYCVDLDQQQRLRKQLTSTTAFKRRASVVGDWNKDYWQVARRQRDLDGRWPTPECGDFSRPTVSRVVAGSRVGMAAAGHYRHTDRYGSEQLPGAGLARATTFDSAARQVMPRHARPPMPSGTVGLPFWIATWMRLAACAHRVGVKIPSVPVAERQSFFTTAMRRPPPRAVNDDFRVLRMVLMGWRPARRG